MAHILFQIVLNLEVLLNQNFNQLEIVPLKNQRLKVSQFHQVFLSLNVNGVDRTYKLNDITIVESDEKNIIYYDDKFIICKSNHDSDIYDALLFGRDIENVTIPSFITRIAPKKILFPKQL